MSVLSDGIHLPLEDVSMAERYLGMKNGVSLKPTDDVRFFVMSRQDAKPRRGLIQCLAAFSTRSEDVASR